MTGVQRAGPRAAGAVAVGVFAWWAVADGGYAPGLWYPGALLVAAALAAVARPAQLSTLPRPARWALWALAAYTAWSFASIAWADARGDAWDGANRTLLYLTVFALFAVVPWTPGEAATGLGAFALAVVGAGVWAFGRAVAGADARVFVDGRLAAPVGYENASAALFLVAFWAAVLLAVRRDTPRPARAVLLAAGGVLLHLTVLTQSRGSLVAGLVTLAAAVALTADRRRLLVALAAGAAVTAASLPALLAVYDGADLGPAAVAMALSAALLLAAGLALDRLERWAARPRAPQPRLAAAAGALLVAAGAGLALAGGPLAAPGGGSRFTAGPGSGRYDFWRVAGLELVRNPIGGVGADNFAHDYARDRRGGEEPLYPHSAVVRAFSQTGLVGGALLAAFLGAVVLAAARLRDDPARRPVAVAAGVAAAAWLVHGSIDWLWEMPAVAAPAFAGLGLVAGLAQRPATGERRPAAAWQLPVAVAAALVVALSYAFPALAARDVERAADAYAREPGAALERLDRARALNPLSDRADLVAGALTRAGGDRARARQAFAAALERDGRNWHAHVEVALLDLAGGRRDAALARLGRARALNPLEPLIADALDVARAGEAPSPALLAELAEETLPGPLGRRGLGCERVLGFGRTC